MSTRIVVLTATDSPGFTGMTSPVPWDDWQIVIAPTAAAVQSALAESTDLVIIDLTHDASLDGLADTSTPVLLVGPPEAAPPGWLNGSHRKLVTDPPSLATTVAGCLERWRIDTQIARLGKLGGPPFVAKIVALFVESAPRQVAEARSCDTATSGRLMHNLKSSAAHLGIREVQVLAESAEVAARAGNLPSTSHFDQLAAAVTRAVEYLTHRRD